VAGKIIYAFLASNMHEEPSNSRINAHRLSRFVCVGGAGFIVDAVILTLLVNGFDWSQYSARVLSFGAAVSATWYANRRWVFKPTKSKRGEYGRYVGFQLVGAAINLSAYVSIIEGFPALAKFPVVPLAIGAALALIFNYLASSRFVFRPSV
jgi:putative flippase GtrA